ncbi:PREDICTED: probable zinc transporter 12 [Tarenaya hassleriana]|uniref:probable zinc transporter 12 n=1 Tax=Tarenaya hassleriana TaxID=28532 RepID=UPI00053C5D3F|nr:PREDICTED: probable zinc transporter 12 [Tarenaya hassleriana]
MGQFLKTLFSSLLLCLALLPLLASAEEEDCDSGHGGGGNGADKGKALKFKIAAILSIFIGGVFGVCLPVLGRKFSFLRPESNFFFLIRAFAAGVILATGFIHILPDAGENLTSPCLGEAPWGDFPMSGLIAMASAIVTMLIESFAAGYFQRLLSGEKNSLPVVAGGGKQVLGTGGGHEGHVHVHLHGSTFNESGEIKLIRHKIVTQVLELGIVVHSVIIGLSLGASQDLDTIKPLLVALTFHQLFEGLGLGGCISQAKFKVGTIATMVLFFALTTPVGIGIGIGVAETYNENSPTALMVSGILNSAAAGILIYMALVDLLAAEFNDPKVQGSFRMQISCSLSLLLGAAAMSLLAIWA